MLDTQMPGVQNVPAVRKAQVEMRLAARLASQAVRTAHHRADRSQPDIVVCRSTTLVFGASTIIGDIVAYCSTSRLQSEVFTTGLEMCTEQPSHATALATARETEINSSPARRSLWPSSCKSSDVLLKPTKDAIELSTGRYESASGEGPVKLTFMVSQTRIF